MDKSFLENKLKNYNDSKLFIGQEDYRQASVMILLVEMENEYHFVFEKRNPQIRQGGEICFPGGMVDPSEEDLLATALREVEEEMGIPQNQIQVFAKTSPLISTGGTIIHSFIGKSLVSPQQFKINPSEVESFFTIPVSFFQDHPPETYSVHLKVHPYYTDLKTGEKVVTFPTAQLNLPEYYHHPWGNQQSNILVYPTPYGPIWGITAKLIADFIKNI